MKIPVAFERINERAIHEDVGTRDEKRAIMPKPVLGRFELFRRRSQSAGREGFDGIVPGLGTVSPGEMIGEG